MKDRITNPELKKVHEYMETLENQEFSDLLHKLLATFNVVVINAREWKEKSNRCSFLETELLRKKQEIETYKKRIEIRDDRIKELKSKLEQEEQSGERYFNAYKSAIEREERLKKGITKLKYEIDHRSNTKN